MYYMDFNKVYINGAWVQSKSEAVLSVENPANLEIIATVPSSNEEDVNVAVVSAKNAFDHWKNVSVEERIHYVIRAKEYLEQSFDEITKTIVQELGTTSYFSNRVHVQSSIHAMDNYIKIAKEYPFDIKDDRGIITKEPFGVVAALCPWNYPLLQIVEKVIPAILAGNTVVLKPSKNTPLCAYYLADAFDKAHLPAGVFNMLTGSGDKVGALLASHKEVDVLSFTGSKAVGEKMYAYASKGIKKLILELGGKSAAVLLEDGDAKKCVSSVLSSVCNNTGQTCSALTRLIIPSSRKEEVEDLIKEEIKKYTVGSPFDTGVRVGPLSSRKQFDKVNRYIKIGKAEGATLLIGDEVSDNSNGYFINPVVFTDVTNHMTIAREEIFGPVLSIITYESEREALELANDNEYGLSGAVFGDEQRAITFARNMRTGNVKVNGAYHSFMPFGGYKGSGIGRESGIYGFEEYLDVKAIMI